MVERNHSSSPSISELVVPKNRLLTSEKKKITSADLYGIFGMDIKLIIQLNLKSLGIVSGFDEIEFLNDPIVHSYLDEEGNKFESDGQYFIEDTRRGHGVLASYLPPRSRTSEHMHGHPIQERYIQIAGESIVNIGDTELNLGAGMEAIVPIETEHQVRTGRMPGFMLIIMENAGLVPRSQWHRPTHRYSKK